MNEQTRRLADDAALITSILILVLIATDASGPVREMTAIVFALAVPGWVVVSRLRIGDLAVEAILTAGLSIAIGTAASIVAFWSHLFRPTAIQAFLALVAVAALGRKRLLARNLSDPAAGTS